MTPLILNCTFAWSLRTWIKPFAAESCDTPSACSSTFSTNWFVPCGSDRIISWLIVVRFPRLCPESRLSDSGPIRSFLTKSKEIEGCTNSIRPTIVQCVFVIHTMGAILCDCPYPSIQYRQSYLDKATVRNVGPEGASGRNFFQSFSFALKTRSNAVRRVCQNCSYPPSQEYASSKAAALRWQTCVVPWISRSINPAFSNILMCFETPLNDMSKCSTISLIL